MFTGWISGINAFPVPVHPSTSVTCKRKGISPQIEFSGMDGVVFTVYGPSPPSKFSSRYSCPVHWPGQAAMNVLPSIAFGTSKFGMSMIVAEAVPLFPSLSNTVTLHVPGANSMIVGVPLPVGGTGVHV